MQHQSKYYLSKPGDKWHNNTYFQAIKSATNAQKVSIFNETLQENVKQLSRERVDHVLWTLYIVHRPVKSAVSITMKTARTVDKFGTNERRGSKLEPVRFKIKPEHSRLNIFTGYSLLYFLSCSFESPLFIYMGSLRGWNKPSCYSFDKLWYGLCLTTAGLSSLIKFDK